MDIACCQRNLWQYICQR